MKRLIPSARRRAPQRGATLIEGMAAAAILAFGISGVFGGLLFASQQNAAANRLSQASAIAAQVRAGLQLQGRARLFADTGPLSNARCSGASRGCAARATRCSPALSAASSGCTLPVAWACSSARRTADSMSTTRFSSRERERLCISSSSWARCSVSSDTRVSSSARRAAASLTVSCAWRARARASVAWTVASAL